MPKTIFLVASGFSALGKGSAISSLGFLLKMRGLSVALCKQDGYLNTSASCLRPLEHGETYICDDSAEVDLDIGHYFRISGTEVGRKNIMTAGSLYKELISEEESGKYLGKTLQVVPDLTDKITERLKIAGEGHDVLLVEVGGVIRDLENQLYLENVREWKQRNFDDTLIILLSPLLWVPTISEWKTKLVQTGVKDLQSYGLQPDIILCRIPAEPELPKEVLHKIASMTNTDKNAVFKAVDVKSLYEIPIKFWEQHIDDLIVDKFRFKRNGSKIHKYKALVEKYMSADNLPEVEIGVITKYVNEEAHVSLKESLYHSGLANDVRVKRRWINAEDLEKTDDIAPFFEGLSGVITCGGFDVRGVEGKVKGISFCRENKIPFLGICLGLQCSVIEFSRNVLGLMDANSQEFDPGTPNPVVHYLEGQSKDIKKSGTMRLGSYDCVIADKTSIAFEVYKKKNISERHRHRLEVNGEYVTRLGEKGFKVSGVHVEEGKEDLVEIMELDRSIHPYFIGCQGHPEFKSRLGDPAPLFFGLIQAAVVYKNSIPTDNFPVPIN